MNNINEIKRGDIILTELVKTNGSVQHGKRPCMVIQNDIGNKKSPTIIVAALTSQTNKAKLPTHVDLPKEIGLTMDSVVMFEQVRTISKEDVIEVVTTIVNNKDLMKKVDKAIMVSFGIEISEVKQITEQEFSSVPSIIKFIQNGVTALKKVCKENNENHLELLSKIQIV